MLTALKQAFFLLASWTLATSAHASYGQMRLEGIALLLLFALMVAYGLIVDLAMFARIFRYRAALVVASVVALALVFLLLGQAASASERAGFFKVFSGGSGLVLLVVTSAVFLPFIVVAPVAQYLAMRHGRPWPGWIAAWMALQLALLPIFVILELTDRYYRQQEYAAGEAEGRQVRAGELGPLLERAEQRHERIWGTAWTYPWLQKPPAESSDLPSGWTLGLAVGMDASALIAANEPLGAPDRAALRTLMDRHFLRYSVPHTRVKLLWDALEPGSFSAQLAPTSEPAPRSVGEEEIAVLLERLEKYGEARFCPGGRMMEADRTALNALALAKGRVWNVATRAYEMRPH